MGNNTRIEKITNNLVSGRLLKSSCLLPHFNEDDKIIGYDGYIEVYSSSEMKKDDLIDKLQVQIRGRTRKSKVFENANSLESNSIQSKELELYYRGNGVLYFLVLNPNSVYNQIYYKYLFPKDIRTMIDQKKNRTKLLKLDEANIKEFYTFCKFCIEEKNYQSQISNIPIDTLIPPTELRAEDIVVKRGITPNADIFEITIFQAGGKCLKKINIKCSDPDLFKMNSILEDDWYTYIKRGDSPFLTPIFNSGPKISVHNAASRIKLSNNQNQIFFEGSPRLETKNNVSQIYFSNSLYLELHDRLFSWKFNFNDTLGNLFTSMQILDALCNNTLLINDSPLKYVTSSINEIQRTLSQIQPMKEIFEIVNTFPTLNILKEYRLIDKEFMHLENLYRAYILKDCSFLRNTQCPKNNFLLD